MWLKKKLVCHSSLTQGATRALEREREMKESCGEEQPHHSEQLVGNQLLIVLKSPTKGKTTGDIEGGLEWWSTLLTGWVEGKVSTLVSPSTTYDPRETKAATLYKDHQHPLEGL